MNHFVYIIYSSKLNKYYVGFTTNVSVRLEQHNKGISTFTSRGIPWKLIHVIACDSETSARLLEKKIKGRGIKRFLMESGVSI